MNLALSTRVEPTDYNNPQTLFVDNASAMEWVETLWDVNYLEYSKLFMCICPNSSRIVRRGKP